MKKIILIFTILITISNSTFGQIEWTYNDNPKVSGWDSTELTNFNKYIIDSTKVTGLMIMQYGKVLFEYGDIKENSYIASCRKSVLAMIYGKYVENGTIDLNKTIKQLGINDVEGILPIEQKATIKDLISARSGVYHPEGYAGGMQQFAPKRGSVEPGEYWLYSNWDFNVAGFVFEQETKKNIYDEVEKQLAIPLGMQDWNRSLQVKEGDTTKSKYLAYPMWFSTRDMAKIGQLMLQKGNWNGKQLISEDWINEMIKQRTSFEEVKKNINANDIIDFGYGYMWWLWENSTDPKVAGAYVALGYMGQAIVIYPEINTVLVYKTKEAYGRMNEWNTRLNLFKKVPELYNPK